MKDGTKAQENSVGWYCNCCNYRVRQKPRNKIYKEKLRNEKEENKIKETPTKNNEKNPIDQIFLSKKQAKLIKEISLVLPNKNEKMDYVTMIDRIPESIQWEIKDNWEGIYDFFELATNYEKLNKISMIVLFEKLNKEIGRVATKEEFFNSENINEQWIENEFNSWEYLLELLGHDPWYRNKSKAEPTKTIQKKEIERENIEYSTQTISKSDIELISNIDNLKSELSEYFKSKDNEEKYSDYSYAEMFELLEKYLKIIPNRPHFTHIMNYF